MKTVLALAAILGLSVATASAACGHKDRTASVDKEMTVASIPAGSTTTTTIDTATIKTDKKAQ